MLDTLKYSKRLQAVGVTQEQAEAQAEALRDAVTEELATKAQLDSVELKLSGEIKQLKLLVGLVASLVTAVLVKLLM